VETPIARRIRNEEGIGAKIVDNIEHLNEELSNDARRQQNLSDQMYWEEVKSRENETLSALYNKLVNAGIIKKKKVAAKPVVYNKKKQAILAARAQPKKALNNVVKVEALLSKYQGKGLETLVETPPIITQPKEVNTMPVSPPPAIKPIQRVAPRVITPSTPAVPAPAPAPVPAPAPAPAAEKTASEKRLEALLAASPIVEEPEPPAPSESVAEESEPEVSEEDEALLRAKAQEDAFYELAAKHGLSKEIIEDWKSEYGQSGIFAMVLTEEELYVMTYLRNTEYKEIMKAVRKVTDPERAEEEYNRLVLGTALLYPETGGSMDIFADRRAGTVPALIENIRMRSGLTLDVNQLRALTVVL
jgi:hypothetical protein